MSSSGTNWKSQFSSFGGKAYLDCAAQGPFPLETSEAVRRATRFKEHPEEIPESLDDDLPERARAAAARLIGCHPSSIALCSGASHGINVAAHGLPLEPGDQVVMAQGEFPALVYPFLNLQRYGIQVHFVAPRDGRFVTAADLVAAIGPATRVVATSLVAYATGYRTDLQAIGRACRERGIFLVVDGAQGVGAVDFRIGDFPIDVLGVSGFKWLLGPYGSGFTYVNPRILDKVRVVDVYWRQVEGALNPGHRHLYPFRFREGARRFDIPETASYLNLSAFSASLEFVNRARVPTIEAHVGRLFERLIQGIDGTPLRIVSDLTPGRRSSILALEGSSLNATRLIYRRMRGAGVVVSVRDNLIRVAPHLYNGPDDIDRLLDLAATAPV